jgi:hypothetical protein
MRHPGVAARRGAGGHDEGRGDPDRATVLGGYALVVISFLWFSLMTFNMIGAKFLPEQGPDGNAVLEFLRTDAYYSMLLPCTVPVVLVAVYLVWFSRKLYQHS